ICRARSSLSQSRRYRLAMYSLVSRYGPSVTAGAPSRRRTSPARTASARPYAPSSSPLSRYFLLKASCFPIASDHCSAGNELHFSWLPYTSSRYFTSTTPSPPAAPPAGRHLPVGAAPPASTCRASMPPRWRATLRPGLRRRPPRRYRCTAPARPTTVAGRGRNPRPTRGAGDAGPAVRGGDRRLRLRAGEGDRQLPGRVDVAEQHGGQGVAVLFTRIPRLDDGRHRPDPRHEHRSTAVDHDDGVRVGGGDRPAQLVVVAGQGQVRAVGALLLVITHDDDRDMGGRR